MTKAILPPSSAPMLADTAVAPRQERFGQWLSALTDPEWILFLVIPLLPIAFFLVFRDLPRASFFFGTAVYLAVLKWLGWIIFGRLVSTRWRCLLFPAELFVGLAVVCAWCYLRNALGALWPASYGLRELAVLAPLLGVLHLVAAARRLVQRKTPGLPARDQPTRLLLTRALLYVPFWGMVILALWRVSPTLQPQTMDPIFHACAARAAVETGLFQPHLFLDTWQYPSGFAAVNAAAMSLAPLSATQTVNLQHVLWQIVAFYLIISTIWLLAGCRPGAAGLIPIGLLLFVPLYALSPDSGYSGTPRQMAVALFVAVSVLPLLVPVRRAATFVIGGAIVAFLGILAAAMNPACVPFAGFTLVVALVILVIRAWTAFGRRAWWPVALQIVLAGCAAALLLDCDGYYQVRLRRRLTPPPTVENARPASSAPAPTRVPPPATQPASWARRVLLLAPNDTASQADKQSLLWAERTPYNAFPIVALTTAAAALGLVLRDRRRRRALAARTSPLIGFLVGSIAVWLVGKIVILSLNRLTLGVGWEAHLLRAYIGFLLLRWELLMLSAIVCAAGLILFLFAERLRPVPRLFVRAGFVLVFLVPHAPAIVPWPPCGDVVLRPGSTFVTTPNDLALVAWCNEHIPPEKGRIGMAAAIMRAGLRNQEEHLIGLRGMPAFLLHGQWGNYCFTLRSLEQSQQTNYRTHVRDRFDAAWCLQNDVRYFYATPESLADYYTTPQGQKEKLNPALRRAIEDGQLRPVAQFGDSVLYEVQP